MIPEHRQSVENPFKFEPIQYAMNLAPKVMTNAVRKGFVVLLFLALI